MYESKSLVLPKGEEGSETYKFIQDGKREPFETLIAALLPCDVVSFDVFDTLILRAVDAPTDVFYFVGEKLNIPNFKALRMRAEYEARMQCWKEKGHTEIGLAEIWDRLEYLLGIDAEYGMKLEIEAEMRLCFANPYMKHVWDALLQAGKPIVVTSDMYLSRDVIRELLSRNGFEGMNRIFVSNEYGTNKASGGLFAIVKEYADQMLGRSARMIHVGDNPRSDYVKPRACGIDSYLYTNVNANTLLYRATDLSYLVGSAYRGTISTGLYAECEPRTPEYEFGFIYGGLFVLGYCNFVHEYCASHGIQKILFLSRDGDILKQVYDRLYPGDASEYVYWSRKAATKLMAGANREDYFRRFIDHKVNQGYTISDALKSMELSCLIERLPDWSTIWERDWKANELNSAKGGYVALVEEDELTSRNAGHLKHFLYSNWDTVMEVYKSQMKGAKTYYSKALKGISRAAAVDIGWAGSGAMSLRYLIRNVWDLDCDLIGIVAGTNTVHNIEADASESFLQSGSLVSYLYSASFNRDLWKKHDPGKDYNVYWELLLSSTQPGFNGFGLNERGEVTFDFGSCDANLEGIRQIQQGIMDFCNQYTVHFKEYPYMLNISGRDAYAPMLVAASYGEKYLRQMAKRFALEKNVV